LSYTPAGNFSGLAIALFVLGKTRTFSSFRKAVLDLGYGARLI